MNALNAQCCIKYTYYSNCLMLILHLGFNCGHLSNVFNIIIIVSCNLDAPCSSERVRVLRGHRGLVKGVTWDPVCRYVATQADDRTLVVWRTSDWGQETVVTRPFQEVGEGRSPCGSTTTVVHIWETVLVP